MKTAKIVIDSTSRILYSSFYIKGLYDVFGKENVSFGRKQFKQLYRTKEQFSYQHFFAFIVVIDNNTTRYVIDFCDPIDINSDAYDWCDVYAKINNDEVINQHYNAKMVLIPPSFGIKIWNFRQTVFHFLTNWVTSVFSLPTTTVTFLKDYYQQYKRASIEIYLMDTNEKSENVNPYIFMIGTLWKESDFAENTNEARKKFIQACKKIDHCTFEGGFFALPNHLNYQKFKEFTFSKSYSIFNYIKKTKRSEVVFNTPAVHNCHGWKLAEFLAMGKPIISKKLSHELPVNLMHNKNIHFISDDKEIENAIRTILENQNYKQLLATNAKNYFLEYMTPEAVIISVLNKRGLLDY